MSASVIYNYVKEILHVKARQININSRRKRSRPSCSNVLIQICDVTVGNRSQ